MRARAVERVLVGARLVQGAAGGILNPQVSGLIQQLFRGAERARAFGLLGATIGISTAVGPVVGGLILDRMGQEHGWRWIFFVNLPVAVAAVVLAARWLPAPPPRDRTRRVDLDPVGVVLLGTAVVAILLPIVEANGRGLSSVPWWVAGIGVAVAGLFVAWEWRYTRRCRTPVVDLALFSTPGYAAGASVGTIYFAGFTGIFFVLTIYVQLVLGYSPLLAGLTVTPFAAGSAVSSALSGRLVSRLGRALVTWALVVVLAGVVLADVVLAVADGPYLGWALAGPLLLAGLGSGLVIAPNITLTVADVPVERAGTAGGLLQTGQRIGTATGIALIGTVFFATPTTVTGAGVPSTGGDGGAPSASLALRVAAALIAVALATSAADLVLRRRTRSAPISEGRPIDADRTSDGGGGGGQAARPDEGA